MQDAEWIRQWRLVPVVRREADLRALDLPDVLPADQQRDGKDGRE